MPASTKWYGRALEGQLSGTASRRIDWTGDTIRVSLHSSAYTPDQDADDFYTDATNEVSGTEYTAGGLVLTGKSVSYDSGSGEVRLLADSPMWGSSGSPASITARYAVIWKDTGSAATSPLVGYVDFGADESVVSGILTVNLDSASGVLKIRAA